MAILKKALSTAKKALAPPKTLSKSTPQRDAYGKVNGMVTSGVGPYIPTPQRDMYGEIKGVPTKGIGPALPKALPANFGEFVAGLQGGSGGGGGGGGSFSASSMSASGGGGIPQPTFSGGYQSPAAREYGLTPEQEAMIQGDIEYKPRESALAAALAAAKATTKQGVETQQGYGTKQGENLKNIYDQLTAALQQSASATGGIFDSAKRGTQDVFEQLLSRQQNTKQGLDESMRANAEKLGLTAALDDPQKRLQNTLAELQGFSTAQNQNVQGALAAQGANEQAFAQRGVTQAQNIGAQSQRDLSTQVADAVAQLQLQGQGAELDYGRQQSDLGMQKQSAVRKLTHDIQQARTATERQDAEDAFARYMQEQSMEMQRARLGFDVDKANQGYNLDMQKFQLDQQKANTSDPLERAKLQAQIDNLNSSTSKNLGLTGGSTDKPTNTALERFYASPQSGYWGSEGAGPLFRQDVNSIITGAAQSARDAAAGGATGIQADPYTIAQSYIANHPGKNPDALRAALQLYYGKK